VAASRSTPGCASKRLTAKAWNAEGIGLKGLATISAWLRHHGHELAVDASRPRSPDMAPPAQGARKVEKALRALQSHGYQVVRSQEREGDRTPAQRTSPGIADPLNKLISKDSFTAARSPRKMPAPPTATELR